MVSPQGGQQEAPSTLKKQKKVLSNKEMLEKENKEKYKKTFSRKLHQVIDRLDNRKERIKSKKEKPFDREDLAEIKGVVERAVEHNPKILRECLERKSDVLTPGTHLRRVAEDAAKSHLDDLKMRIKTDAALVHLDSASLKAYLESELESMKADLSYIHKHCSKPEKRKEREKWVTQLCSSFERDVTLPALKDACFKEIMGVQRMEGKEAILFARLNELKQTDLAVRESAIERLCLHSDLDTLKNLQEKLTNAKWNDNGSAVWSMFNKSKINGHSTGNELGPRHSQMNTLLEVLNRTLEMLQTSS